MQLKGSVLLIYESHPNLFWMKYFITSLWKYKTFNGKISFNSLLGGNVLNLFFVKPENKMKNTNYEK